MAENPLITFKAGQCFLDGTRCKPDPTPGYIYLFEEDELTHFCWRDRKDPATSPDIDLITFPGDATFTPYTGRKDSAKPASDDVRSPVGGRIYVLKFSSSSQRHFFWLQSKPQHPDGDKNWFSKRDLRVGEIVNELLSGEEIDVPSEVSKLNNSNNGQDGDDDDVMEDVQQPEHNRQGSGGAGADATGGDPRAEGEASREGGADGGRAAPTDANDAVQNFLRSLQGSSLGGSQQPQQSRQQGQGQSYDRPFTSLPELLSTSTTVPWLSTASSSQINSLCTHLPPSLFLLAQESSSTTSSADPSPETVSAAIEAMALEQKRELLQRVLRSPQLNQSLGSLTFALRDGGLPMISEALGVKVRNGGMVKGASMPLGGGEAVEAFMDGVKKRVQEKKD